MRSLLLARKGENAENNSKLLTIVDNSPPTVRACGTFRLSRGSKRRQYCSPVNVQSIKIECGNNLWYKDVIFMRPFRQLLDF